MRTFKNSQSIHSQTFKLFTKYFEVNFDIKRVAIALKKNEKDVQNKLKQEIKKLVVDIEGELLREKKIIQPYFINSMMPKVFTQLLSFDKILDQNTSMHLLTYYRGKYAEFMNNPQAFLLNNCDYRIEIYQAFLKYAKTVNYLNNSQHIQQQQINPIQIGYLEKRQDVYNLNQMTMIFNLYKCHIGNINKIYRDMQMKGYRSIKFQRNVIYFKLENLKLIGLYKIYKISAQQWAGGYYLRWKKFIECYCDINQGWPYEMQLRLLQIAVLDNINQNDAKQFTYKMALAFIKKKNEKMKPIFEKQDQSMYPNQIRDEKQKKVSQERSDN